MEHVTLYYRQGSSDKTYAASIQPMDGGYVVQFQYGRRGSALQSGQKTSVPVAYDHAKSIYDKLVAQKINSGYTPGEDGTPYQGTEKANQATGIHCQLLNPVEEDQVEKLLADPAWWLQPKHDGRRLLIQKRGDQITGITREGVLINCSVRYWRGCKKLQPEDLGLDAQDVSDRLISLGHKRLLPKEATADLALIEGRAHAIVEASTFPFLNGLGHFLPNAKLGEISNKLAGLETEFWRAKDEFVRQYAGHRAKAMEEWHTAASKLVPEPERLVAAIGAAFPVALEKYFGFDVTLFQIAVPEQVQADLVTLAEQEEIIRARRQAAENASAKIRGDVENFVAECVASLREQTAQLCGEMLQSINDGKTEGVHQKTLNRLVRFIDQFKAMNFANDTEMEAQLEKVRRELLSRTAAEYRDSTHAQRQLRQGLNALAGKARELVQTDATELVQRFGELGKRRFNLAA